jgi:hypothetical protein
MLSPDRPGWRAAAARGEDGKKSGMVVLCDVPPFPQPAE